MKKRIRSCRLHAMLSDKEMQLLRQRMEESETQNMSAFVRKMLLDGYIVKADLSAVRQLVGLQRRCVNNLAQIARHTETNNIYQTEIAELQKGYDAMWRELSELLKQLSALIAL